MPLLIIKPVPLVTLGYGSVAADPTKHRKALGFYALNILRDIDSYTPSIAAGIS